MEKEANLIFPLYRRKWCHFQLGCAPPHVIIPIKGNECFQIFLKQRSKELELNLKIGVTTNWIMPGHIIVLN